MEEEKEKYSYQPKGIEEAAAILFKNGNSKKSSKSTLNIKGEDLTMTAENSHCNKNKAMEQNGVSKPKDTTLNSNSGFAFKETLSKLPKKHKSKYSKYEKVPIVHSNGPANIDFVRVQNSKPLTWIPEVEEHSFFQKPRPKINPYIDALIRKAQGENIDFQVKDYEVKVTAAWGGDIHANVDKWNPNIRMRLQKF